MLQFLVQVPALRAIGFRGGPSLDLRLSDPALRQIVRRMGPVILSVAATNIMLVITTILASRGDGWAATLNYAFRLVHLPIGLIGVALGTVLLAAGARRSAAQDPAGLDDLVRRGLRLNWFLALPAAVGLFVFAEPVVRMIYEWGRFGAASRLGVAEALRWYAGGIVFYAGIKAAAPRFLAAGDTRTPMLCSLVGIAVNCVVAFAGIADWGFRALAFAVAAGAASNYLCLRVAARRRYGPGSAPAAGFFARVGTACALLGRSAGPRSGSCCPVTLRCPRAGASAWACWLPLPCWERSISLPARHLGSRRRARSWARFVDAPGGNERDFRIL